jgi:diguanylate cyclase (GGDEF)-like protein
MFEEAFVNYAALGTEAATLMYNAISPDKAFLDAAMKILHTMPPFIKEAKIFTVMEDMRYLQENIFVNRDYYYTGNDIVPLNQIEFFIKKSFGVSYTLRTGQFEIMVPLVLDGVITGLLLLTSERKPEESMIKGLEDLAKGLVLGVNHVVYVKKAQAFKNIQMTASSISSEINAMIDSEFLLHRFVKLVVDRLGFDRTTLFVFNEDRKTVKNCICALRGREVWEDVFVPPINLMEDSPKLLSDIQGFFIPLKVGSRRLGAMLADNFLTLEPVIPEILEVVFELCRNVLLSWENSILFNRVKELAIKDELTGMYRPGYFYELVESEIMVHETFAFVTIDIDFFKQINDTFGHQVGDRLIFEVANVIRNYFKHNGLMCRMGGDEFLIAIPDISLAECCSMMNGLLDNFRKNVFILDGNVNVKISFSAGISIYPHDGVELKKLIRKSDSALYLSKRNGRSRISVAGECSN